MNVRSVITIGLLAAAMSTSSRVLAQVTPPDRLDGFAVDSYHPTPAGDRFFAVQDPTAPGHLRPALQLLFDYSNDPLTVYFRDTGDEAGTIVSDRLLVHLGGSLTLVERVLLSLELPFALINDGSSLTSSGQTFEPPDAAAIGDLRLGVRGRVLGRPDGLVHFGAGAHVWLPTGIQSQYLSDGGVRGQVFGAVGGRSDRAAPGTPLVYAANVGLLLRGGDYINVDLDPSFTWGLAAGVLVADEALQIGPEWWGWTQHIESLNSELLLGARYTKAPFTFGLGGGIGLSTAVGSPDFRVVASLVYVGAVTEDQDGDGILDKEDACPDRYGQPSSDPTKHGCPPPGDRDGDGVLDEADACPDVPGVKSDDAAKNGCPEGDRDGDGIKDGADACPDVKGVEDPDPKKHGCPEGDRDGDTIVDGKDACPDVKGVADPDPKKHGCPGDTDGDGITDDKDACPREKGKADPDPTKNGCPSLVRVTETGVEILQQVQFETGRAVIKKESDELLTQVAQVLGEHPEIKKILVEGHTDNRGAAAMNLALSQKRADAVKTWLVARGIDPNRLEAKGFGPDRPIDTNATPEGRQKNRRVEFKILDPAPRSGGGPAKPAAPAAAPPAAPAKPKP